MSSISTHPIVTFTSLRMAECQYLGQTRKSFAEGGQSLFTSQDLWMELIKKVFEKYG